MSTDIDLAAPVPAVLDLHRRIRSVVAAVVVTSRLATFVMVGLSIAGLTQANGYTSPPLAVAAYAVVGLWGAVFIALAARHDQVPGWVLTVDVAVTCAGMVALAQAGQTYAFVNVVANPDLEPVTVAVAAAVALVGASGRRTALSCTAMAAAYAVAQASVNHRTVDVLSDLSVMSWQAGTGCCCYVFIQRLHGFARTVDAAAEEVTAARERVAARQAQDEERIRQFREQVRRYRTLHDGPLRILTAIAGPGPAGHPDPAVREQCAVSVNVLRGAAPDEAGGSLTDLSLALIEAGNQSAVYGLRVTYHFANLPEHLPTPVIDALARASAEALSNVAAHAGTGRAQLSALAVDGAARPGVTVAVVDQGKGFDPDAVQWGYGVRNSILARVAEVGGAANVDSHPGQGTRVDLRWPA